jgi:hypothetical protein
VNLRVLLRLNRRSLRKIHYGIGSSTQQPTLKTKVAQISARQSRRIYFGD